MKTIYLTGFMGSGKSTIGKELSGFLNTPVIDTDERIEQETGLTIRDIFSTHGESYFRDLESRTLFSLPTDNHVVTTGGGMVIREQNREWMKKNGVIVYLHCDFDTIWKRLENDQTRPLVIHSKKEEIKQLFMARQQYYDDYSYKINSSQPLQEVIKELSQLIKNK